MPSAFPLAERTALVPGDCPSPAGLQRHQLWHLTSAGWRRLLAQTEQTEQTEQADPEAQAAHRPQRPPMTPPASPDAAAPLATSPQTLHTLIAHWAAADLPLVVTRQSPDPAAPGTLAFGLPAPCAWGRRKLALRVHPDELDRPADFPMLTEVQRWRAAAHDGTAPALADLDADLRRLGVTARVHGSHGWELLSGLPCRTATSDLDLLLPVRDAAQADAAVAGLLRADARLSATPGAPRLDGELIGPDGGGIAWREWAQRHAAAAVGTRAGSDGSTDERPPTDLPMPRSAHTPQPLLVKHLHGPRLVARPWNPIEPAARPIAS
ncbi:malonate decarboxylase holo-[acyl-carrier-protein] synthase [Pseudaquabacterium rugosum]|uniref:Malonate decarboxylase holo-[acyl-carrier-protein] synthase n=1 Tax=Pseudaquabacterium rugosum TaxID=2984194 RepID=A0ABU9BAT2_9BURK